MKLYNSICPKCKSDRVHILTRIKSRKPFSFLYCEGCGNGHVGRVGLSQAESYNYLQAAWETKKANDIRLATIAGQWNQVKLSFRDLMRSIKYNLKMKFLR